MIEEQLVELASHIAALFILVRRAIVITGVGFFLLFVYVVGFTRFK